MFRFDNPYLLQSPASGRRLALVDEIISFLRFIGTDSFSISACTFRPFTSATVVLINVALPPPVNLLFLAVTSSKGITFLFNIMSALASISLAQVKVTFVVFPPPSSLLVRDFIIPPNLKLLQVNIAPRPTFS